MKRLPILLILFFALLGTARADLAGDYRLTVEGAKSKKETAQVGKIFLQGEPASPDRAMRMELAPEGASTNEKMVFITVPKQETVYMVMPEAKSYFKMSVKEGASKAPKTPGQGLKESEFKTVGTERLNGQKVVVKEAPLREGAKTVGTMRVYLAPDLGNEPLKSVLTEDDGDVTTIAIENPVYKDLPDSLFQVPKGYSETKLPSIGKMMDQLGEEAKKEGRSEAREKEEDTSKAIEKGIRDRLPF